MQDMREELACIFYNTAGPDEELWADMWDSQGRCSGLNITQFFDAVVYSYYTFNANASSTVQ